MEEKKKLNPFLKILIILFVVYIAYYIAMESGYYENSIHNKTIITKEKMIEFENDVKNGKVLDVDNYIVVDQNNHENTISKLGREFSSTVENFMNDTINFTMNLFKTFFS